MSTLFLVMVLLNIASVAFSKKGQCAGSCGRPPFKRGEYSYTSSGYYNPLTLNTDVYFVNKSHVLITWSPHKSNPRMWNQYMIRWSFDKNENYNCALLTMNHTSVLVENEKHNLKKESKIDLQVDAYPLPKNSRSYYPGTFRLLDSSSTRNQIDQVPCSVSGQSVSSTPRPLTEKSSTTTTTGQNISSTMRPPTEKSSSTTTTTTTTTTDKNISSAVPFQGKVSTTSTVFTTVVMTLGVGLTVISLILTVYVYLKRRRKSSSTHEDPDEANNWGKNLIQDSAITAAKCEERSFMVSYFPENEDYIDEIASIVNWFREHAGYPMIMDKMATPEICSKGHVRWAGSQIQKADKVLVFLSPGYKAMYTHDDDVSQRLTDEKQRVWYEMQLLQYMYCNTRSATKIVCVLLDDKMDTQNLPPWAVVTYRWPQDRDKIVVRLNDISEIAPVEAFV